MGHTIIMAMYPVYLTHFSLVTILMATVTLYVSSMFAFRVSVVTFPTILTTYIITTQVVKVVRKVAAATVGQVKVRKRTQSKGKGGIGICVNSDIKTLRF
jgi:hypothetical protein